MPAPLQFDETFILPPLRFRVILGGSAGNLTVTGIRPRDKLLFVGGSALTTGSPNTFSPMHADRTSEFTITANDTINNTGGTATTGAMLFVVWMAVPAKLAP